MNLLALLQEAGVDVTTSGDWLHHQVSGDFTPIGVLWHHTAIVGDGVVRVCRDGRSDLPGPLCNGVPRKSGQIVLVSNGRSNHAGWGDPAVLAALKNNAPRPKPNDSDANRVNGGRWFYAFEFENQGDGVDPWPVHQLAAGIKATAAICRFHGWPASRVIGHREWTRRKVDPRGIDMDHIRDAVASALTQGDDMTPEQEAKLDRVIAFIDNRGWLTDELSKRHDEVLARLDAVEAKVGQPASGEVSVSGTLTLG